MSGVDQRPSTQARQPLSKITRAAHEKEEVVPGRSANETTDALSENSLAGDNGMLFSLDKLFHRRS